MLERKIEAILLAFSTTLLLLEKTRASAFDPRRKRAVGLKSLSKSFGNGIVNFVADRPIH